MPNSKPRILLVDDTPSNLTALEAVLEGLGYELVKAPSGKQALTRLLKEEFDLILLDVHMPEMDGFDTAAEIRKRDKSRQVPIVFITAVYKDDDHVRRGYELGAADYILKPFIPEILRAKVGFLLREVLGKSPDQLN